VEVKWERHPNSLCSGEAKGGERKLGLEHIEGYECPYCGVKFDTLFALDFHKQMRHSIGEKLKWEKVRKNE